MLIAHLFKSIWFKYLHLAELWTISEMKQKMHPVMSLYSSLKFSAFFPCISGSVIQIALICSGLEIGFSFRFVGQGVPEISIWKTQ